MATDGADIFGNSDLFAEFDRTSDRTDRILMSKIEHASPSKSGPEITENDENESSEPTFKVGFSSDSDSDSVSENEFDNHNANGGVHGDEETVNSKKDVTNGCDDNITRLQNEVQKLRQERDRLMKINRKIKPPRCAKGNGGPEVQVMYMNSGISSKYRTTIEKFLINLMCDQASLDNRGVEKRVTKSSLCLDTELEGISNAEERTQRCTDCTAIGCSQFYADFVYDSMGWPLLGGVPSVSEGWEIPLYQQVYFVALPLDEVECEVKKDRRPKASCFNCGESHMIKDCPIPLNQTKIAENRRKFQSEGSKFQGKNARYHAEDDPRFAKYKAGVISDELKDALGLSKSELPPYIYQMRMLGYPPGHMQALTEDNSGLAMFDKHGKVVGAAGDNEEDGEVEANTSSESVDVGKIISYPGFNVECGREYRDDSKRLGMPAMSRSQSKEMMISMLSMKQGVKRSNSEANMSDGGSAAKKKKVDKTCNYEDKDMDLSNDEGTPNKNLSKQLARADTEILSAPASPSGEGDEDVASLEELEEQKKLLQQQLAFSEGTDADMKVLDTYSSQESDDTKSQESDDSFIPPLPPTPIRPPLPTDTPPRTPPVSGQRTGAVTTPVTGLDNSLFKTPDGPPRLLRTPSSGGSLSMSLGTPITDKHALDTKSKGLPEPSNFAEGIAQHIPFENLPNSTGTYERMKGLIDRIRSGKDS